MFAIGILCLLLSPILITLPLFNGCDSKHSASGSIQESLLNPSASTENDDSAEDEKRRVAAETAMLPTDNTIQMISGLDCWLLWIGVAALAGGGQLVSANVNQMCESLGALLQLAGRERERERERLCTPMICLRCDSAPAVDRAGLGGHRIRASGRRSVALCGGQRAWSHTRWLAERGHPPVSIGATDFQPVLRHRGHGTRPSVVFAGAWHGRAIYCRFHGSVRFWSGETLALLPSFPISACIAPLCCAVLL